SHSLVEGQRLDILGDGSNGLVRLASQGLVFASGSSVELTEQPPQALHKLAAAVDASSGPREVAFGRAVRQHEPTHRVGAVTGDDLVWVDHVLLRLGHLLDAAEGYRMTAFDGDPVVAVLPDFARRQPRT